MAYNLKTITKIIPFTDSDFELYIPWLEDLAREGLFVRKLYGIYGDFEKGKPAALRYRIIPSAKGKAGEDERAFFEENGWDYVCKKDELSIYCKADDGSPDLFTDAVSFAERSRRWQLFMLAETALYILIAVFVGRMFGRLVFAESGGWLHALHDLGPISLISLILLLLLALFIAAWRSVSSIFLIRRIREGKLRLNRSYQKAVFRNKLILILYFILFISAHLYTFRRGQLWMDDYEKSYKEAGLEQIDPIFYEETIAQIAPAWPEWEENDDEIASSSEAVKTDEIDYQIEKDSDLLFTDGKTVFAAKYTDDGSASRYFYSRLYEARNDAIAQAYLNEELSSEEKSGSQIRELEANITASKTADDANIAAKEPSASYISTDPEDFRTLYRLQGNRLQIITYKGPSVLQ